jgi:hypothetical protein
MSTDESTPETSETTTEEVVIPDRPAGISDEKWDAFEAKFDAFAEDVKKGLNAKRPAAPKQTVTTPSKKPVETATETKTTETEKPKKKSRGWWA